MRVIIGADLVPTKSNRSLFAEGNIKELIGEELFEILKGADYRIFNLETPLCDETSPIQKNGPALIAPTDTVNGYKALGVDLLTMANNHILDQGIEGLDSTVEALERAGLNYVGVGDKDTASAPYIFEFANKRIGVYACVEHEFSTVYDYERGANPFDALDTPDHIVELKKQCDYVIVLYHGGKEHYRYPSPNLQKTCRKLVTKGADLVICQHSHCIGCEEEYVGGRIVYGQGNFLFDLSDNEYWQTGLLVALNENLEVEYLPIVKCAEKVRLADEAQRKQILSDFYARSEEIKDSDAINRHYHAFAKSMIEGYLVALGGKKSIFYRILDKLTGHRFHKIVLKKRYNKKSRLAIQNFIECEAHRELVLQGIKSKD